MNKVQTSVSQLSVQHGSSADWQRLIRHDTLGIIKNKTFKQLASDPALIELLEQTAQIRRQLLEFFCDGCTPAKEYSLKRADLDDSYH